MRGGERSGARHMWKIMKAVSNRFVLWLLRMSWAGFMSPYPTVVSVVTAK